ncbi:hypothetical protein CCACVL1_12766 [Corchorus capsularis]|uniref:Uncharacterized protein n=1 Tax=Corchorus capsularis TaxID=210143 RepID=A0A1R3IDW3_COCAP|nr:hypothetical protein CCACVL1_12766 [Corchorus capsularis]
MGRKPCYSNEEMMIKGAWTAQEDRILKEQIRVHGEGRWTKLSQKSGLRRSGKSCRLRWLNYLRPDIKRGNITADEEELIIRMHKLLGNRWSLIAGRLPGRTDNEIKNYWKTKLGKKVDLLSSIKIQSPLKYNGVLMNPQPLKPAGNSDESKTEAGQRDSDKFFMSNNIANDMTPAFATQDNNNNQSDFLLDFNLEDFHLLDHFDLDFSEFCNFSYSAIDHNDSVLPPSDDPLQVFCSETMPELDPLEL